MNVYKEKKICFFSFLKHKRLLWLMISLSSSSDYEALLPFCLSCSTSFITSSGLVNQLWCPQCMILIAQSLPQLLSWSLFQVMLMFIFYKLNIGPDWLITNTEHTDPHDSASWKGYLHRQMCKYPMCKYTSAYICLFWHFVVCINVCCLDILVCMRSCVSACDSAKL